MPANLTMQFKYDKEQGMYRDRTVNQIPESFAFFSRNIIPPKLLRWSVLLMLIFISLVVLLTSTSGLQIFSPELKRTVAKFLFMGFVVAFFSSILLEFAVLLEDFLRLIGFGRSDHLVFSERKIEFKTLLIGAWNNLLPDEEKLATVSFNNEDLQRVVFKRQAGNESDFLFVFKQREILVKIKEEQLAASLKCYLQTALPRATDSADVQSFFEA